jgi:hypothetical protein
MAEPDHVFVKPLPNLAVENDPAAFPFFYITPSEHEKIIRKYYPEERGPVTDIDPIGNSPVIIKKVFLDAKLSLFTYSRFVELIFGVLLLTKINFTTCFCLGLVTS